MQGLRDVHDIGSSPLVFRYNSGIYSGPSLLQMLMDDPINSLPNQQGRIPGVHWLDFLPHWLGSLLFPVVLVDYFRFMNLSLEKPQIHRAFNIFPWCNILPYLKFSKPMIPQHFFPNHPMVQQKKRSAPWQNRTTKRINEQFERFLDRNLVFSHLLEHSILDAIKGMESSMNKWKQIGTIISRMKSLLLNIYLHLTFTNILQRLKARVFEFKGQIGNSLRFVNLVLFVATIELYYCSIKKSHR